MSHGKQFTLYSHNSVPNGWYVITNLKYVLCTIIILTIYFQEGRHCP